MTSEQIEHRDQGAPAVLAQMQDEVRELTNTLWAARGAGELMDSVAAVESLKSSLDALELGMLHELDVTNSVKAVGWASTQDFVTSVAGGHKATCPPWSGWPGRWRNP